MHAAAADRQEYLIAVNVAWLRQARGLLDRISDAHYTASPIGLAPHKAGGHLRHILEFYECFLAGLAKGRIDYDARKRDLSLETSRQAAQARIRILIRRLESERALRVDSLVCVRMEGSAGSRITEPFLVSSVGRELQVLSSHTIHHFALMAVSLRALGEPLEPDFGVAPSTLRYRVSQAAGEAA
jgi:uncharacterized damage-inducible protein DinB